MKIQSFVKSSIFFAVLACCSLSFAKDMYLTVRRDFSAKELPVVEMTYKKPGPVTLRVLKPKDLRKFIEGQLDLRRAWREPKSQYNTARSLVMGLNAMKMNVDWVRYHFSEKLRRGMLKEFGGGLAEESRSNIPVGPKRLIQSPEGFDIVTEYVTSPETIDTAKPFDVPGIDWFWGESGYSYKTKDVELPGLKNGFYVVQVIQGDQEGQVVVVVNDLRVGLQQTDTQALLRVRDRAGRPVPDAHVSLRSLRGEWFVEGKSNEFGEVSLRTEGNNDLVALIEGPDSYAIVDTEFFSNTASTPDVYILTDRPMYKPKDPIHFKGISRRKEKGQSANFIDAQDISMSLVNASTDISVGTPVQVAMKGDYATFTGQIQPPEVETGVYQLQATTGEHSEHGGEVRIKNYIKPLYYLTLTANKDSLKGGDSVNVTVKADRYAGGVPGLVNLSFEFLRVRYDGPEWVDDAGLSEAGSKVTYGFDDSAKTPIIPIHLETFDGFTMSGGKKMVTLKIPDELPGDANFNYKIMLKVSAKDYDGNAAFKSMSFTESTKSLVIQTKSSALFTTQKSEVTCQVRSVTPGGSALSAAGTVRFFLSNYKGEQKLLAEEKIQTDEVGRAKFQFPTKESGEVRAVISLAGRDGRLEKEDAFLLVVPEKSGESVKKVEELTILSRKTAFTAGETAKAFVLLPEAWGENGTNKGVLSITIAGRDIYATKHIRVDGLSTWVETKIDETFGSSVHLLISYVDATLGYVERGIGFRIIDTGRVLNVQTNSDRAILNPGDEQQLNFAVTDVSGKGRRAELSVSVVDQAVLDLQGEFRPSLMDFFYPMERLNLMTFVSSEFQGYGYTETIAKLFKPNKWFAATKAQEVTRKEEDTAYFNGQVETDADGKASVQFRLPGNQTVWQVIVTAVDKEGRFGEGKGSFKAQTDVPIFLVAPAAIRKGEEFVARVIISNQSKKSISVQGTIATRGGVTAMTEAELQFSNELAAGKDFRHSLRLKVKADEVASSGQIKLAVKYGGENRTFDLPIQILPGAAEVVETLAFQNKDEKSFEIAADESIVSARLTVLDGLTGVIVPAMRWMVEYPHGCVEQMTNTLLPSLVLAGLFPDETALTAQVNTASITLWEKIKSFFVRIWSWFKSFFAKGSLQLTEEQRQLIQKARDISARGLDKVFEFQIEDGQQRGFFRWFGDADQGDPAMTLYVLTSLLSQDDIPYEYRPKIEKALDAVALIEYNAGLPSDESSPYASSSDELQMYRLYFGGRSVRYNYRGPDVAQFNFAFEKLEKQFHPFFASLVLMGAKGYEQNYKEQMSGIGSGRKALAARLAKWLDEALSRPYDSNGNIFPADDRFFERSIVRSSSLVAMGLRALHDEGVLDPALKEKGRTYLLSRFNGQNFGSTFETGQTLTHLVWLLKEEMQSRKVGKAPRFAVNGSALSFPKGSASISGWEKDVATAEFQNGKNVLSLSEAEPHQRAQMRLTRLVPFAKVKPQGPLPIEQKFFKLNPRSQELSEITEANPLHVGDYMYVEIRPQFPQQKWTGSSYTFVKFDLPTGFELVQEDDQFDRLNVAKVLSGWERRSEMRNQVYYYFAKSPRWWWKGNQGHRVIGLVLRAAFAGQMSSGISRLEDFYDESVWSQSTAQLLSVLPAQ